VLDIPSQLVEAGRVLQVQEVDLEVILCSLPSPQPAAVGVEVDLLKGQQMVDLAAAVGLQRQRERRVQATRHQHLPRKAQMVALAAAVAAAFTHLAAEAVLVLQGKQHRAQFYRVMEGTVLHHQLPARL
jgi:hypothetical protein